MTDIKKEVEEMVDKFFQQTINWDLVDGGKERAKQCAILHCELVIERFGYIFTSDEDYNAEADHYQTLIEYIKQM